MSGLYRSYKFLRSIFFTAVTAVAALYILLYMALSTPFIQQKIKSVAEKQLSEFIGSDISIGRLNIAPFNELRLNDVVVKDQKGVACLKADEIGAGIDMMRLIFKGKIEITYADLIGLDINLYKETPESPLNIDYIIKAFSPKNKNKPPTLFDLKLHNVVIRKSSLKFDKNWILQGKPDKIDFNHLRVTDLKADIALPRIKNDDFIIDCRWIAFKEKSGLEVDRISLLTHITPTSISLNDLKVQLPGTVITPSDISLNFDGFAKIKEALLTGTHHLVLVDNTVSPSDFAFLLPTLKEIGGKFILSLDVAGNAGSFKVDRFMLSENAGNFSVDLVAEVDGLPKIEGLSVKDLALTFDMKRNALQKYGPFIPDKSREKVTKMLSNIGDVNLVVKGEGTMKDMSAHALMKLATDIGSLDFDLDAAKRNDRMLSLSGNIATDGLNIGSFIDKDEIGEASMTADLSVMLPVRNFRAEDIEGSIEAVVDRFVLNDHDLSNVSLSAEKKGGLTDLEFRMDNETAQLDVASTLSIGKVYGLELAADVGHIDFAALGLPAKYGRNFSGSIEADLSGTGPDDVAGIFSLHDATYLASDNGSLHLNYLGVTAGKEEDGHRTIRLDSDWMRLEADGYFRFSDLSRQIGDMIYAAVPALSRKPAGQEHEVTLDFCARIYDTNPLTSFFRLPVALGSDLTLNGTIDSRLDVAKCIIDAPYLIQGGKKVIKGTKIDICLGSQSKSRLIANTTLPVKNGEADVALDLSAFNNAIDLDAGWDVRNDKKISGKLLMSSMLTSNPLSRIPDVSLVIKPSDISIGGAQWKMERAEVNYTGNRLSVEGLKIWHDNQFVNIGGVASTLPDDEMSVRLNDIDLNYIFNTLNINYVTFGGHATGEITGSNLFSGQPVAATKFLKVKDLSYNGAVLGDGDLSSRWDNEQKMVSINADIREDGHTSAKVDGGIWVTRDSLSFDMKANKVNASFLQPFMSAFCSDIAGRASGDVKLYGTFKDIDLTGRAFADSIRMKIDFTNVYYGGSDSVILNKGHIIIPGFRIYDRNGNSAMLTGNLRHTYFHNPEFEFKLSDAKNLLCYDTNKSINPDWYGRIYGRGNAILRGRPGIVTMMVDMVTAPNSNFTFVLSETQEAGEYGFLSFTDRRKENIEKAARRLLLPGDTIAVPKNVEVSRPTVFDMEIRGTVTPDAMLTLVMDPKAGDKITAKGEGALQIGYNTESDEMKMYGKYTLQEGFYNFSLQDLILRDFSIRRGSSISFNGDPLQADLNISATYRVNTNLSDLDKSFAYDRELNRTNVPVDAVLNVDGDMQHPSITFDIELPTLTEDVVRKVKSVISTDDMMNRQIIYLLALNRFYTPEYMGMSSGGGELASVASSTISSQLSNMMGQLTDKFTVAPSFRSDKGDFSDMEVDVALSSRLLDNRLLINGNFGYRDRSTSTTTFVGDFDIEYLLSKSGNLRLKAYNHFNDQNYYLRSSLTTQGIGVVYRRDFDNPFTFLKRRNRKTKTDSEKSVRDSLKNEEEKTIRDSVVHN